MSCSVENNFIATQTNKLKDTQMPNLKLTADIITAVTTIELICL